MRNKPIWWIVEAILFIVVVVFFTINSTAGFIALSVWIVFLAVSIYKHCNKDKER